MIPKGLIISCQQCSWELAEDVQSSGIKGIRLCGISDIQMVKKDFPELTIIGLYKESYANTLVRITPKERIDKLKEAGAHFVAVDGTGRQHIDWTRGTNIIADVATIEQARKIMEADACVVKGFTTALSGYTEEYLIKSPYEEPDFKLLEQLVKAKFKVPIIAEGRYWTLSQVEQAFDLGAHAVCIGSAVTRPRYIINRFKQVEKACRT